MAIATGTALALAAGASALGGAGALIAQGGQKNPAQYYTELLNAGVSPQDAQAAAQQYAQAQQQSEQAAGGLEQFAGQAGQMGGMQNMADVYAQQQALAGQLGQLAAGQGPNPALAQLQQATGQNVANQAALMAGQRGAGANTGLMARQIAQQGAATQQQAAGQAATMQAQQQLGAMGALQQQLAGMGSLASQQTGFQQSGLNALMQSRLNMQGMSQQEQQMMLQNLMQQRQQQLAQQEGRAGGQQKRNEQEMQTWGNVAKGVSGALGAAGNLSGGSPTTGVPSGGFGMTQAGQNAWMKYANPYAEGGEVQKYAEGGPVAADSSNQSAAMKEHYYDDPNGPSSEMGKLLMGYARGGSVHDMRSGGHVPGKAPVGGAVDSYSNDIVDAKLSPGEIVLPRSVTKSADPAEAAKRFVAALKNKKGK